MAAVKKSDIPEIAEFFTDFWNMVKATWQIEQKEEYWSEVVHLATSINGKYNGHPFCREQLMAYMDYLDRKAAQENLERRRE